MDEPIMCGDFNLQDFIISRPKKGPHFEELEKLVKSKSTSTAMMESTDISMLRSSWLRQKYPEISLSFLGLTINHQVNKGEISLPKFAICHHKNNVFEIELLYQIITDYKSFMSKSIGVDITFSIKSVCPPPASYNILKGLYSPFEKDIILKNGHTRAPPDQVKQLQKIHSMEYSINYNFQTYLSGLKPQSIEETIKEISICGDNIYFIYMNKPEDYNATAKSRHIKSNILAIMHNDFQTFAIGNFNPIPIDKYLLKEDVKQ